MNSFSICLSLSCDFYYDIIESIIKCSYYNLGNNTRAKENGILQQKKIKNTYHSPQMRAKELFIGFFLITFVLCNSMKLNIDSSITISPGQKVYMPITCSGGQGKINMDAKGLPKGLIIQEGYLRGETDASSGFFPVLIDARDDYGNFVSQILMIKVGKQSGAQITVSNGQTIATTTINSAGSSTTSIPVNNLSISANIQGGLTGQGAAVNSISISQQNSFINQQSSYTNQIASPSGSSQAPIISFIDNTNVQNGPVPEVSFTDLTDTRSSRSQSSMAFSPSSSYKPIQVTNTNAPNNPSISLPSPFIASPTSPASSSSIPTPSQYFSPPSAPTSDLNTLLSNFAPNVNINPNNRQVNPNIPLDRQSYPTPNLPTGTAPNSPINTTPMMIQRAQAPRSQSYRNQATPDSVKATAIFQRQLNSNKAIANLLDIIDQLRANTNAAKSDIPTLQAQLKNAVSAQRTAQSKVMAAQTQKNRLTTAINSLNDNVNLLRGQLAQLEGSFKDSAQTIIIKRNQIANVASQIEKNEINQRDILNKISNQKDQIAKTQGLINAKQDSIQKTKMELDRRTKEVQSIDADIDGAVRNIKNIDEEIIDLKARVNAAVNRKLLAQEQQKRLRSLKINAPAVKAGLEAKSLQESQDLDRLLSQRQKLNNDLSKLNNQYEDINLSLNRARSQLKQIQTEINVVSGNKQNFDGTISGKNKEISEALSNLQYLKNQVTTYDNILRNAYNQGNDANGRVQVAKQNLQALIKKWERQSKLLSQATLNLEKARAEKQLADLAMEQILRQRSSVLPYSVVPNGNGVSAAGTPTGNNPRGSPLGPLQESTVQRGSNPYSQQSKKITDYSNYLSSAYSNGVDPTKPSTVNRNFPFTIYQTTNNLRNQMNNNIYSNQNVMYGLNGQPISSVTLNDNGLPTFIGDFSCRNSRQNISGVIKLIGVNALTVQTDTGKILTVKIGSCSQGRANIANYSMRAGDRIDFLGQRDAGNGNAYNLYEATCKCEKC